MRTAIIGASFLPAHSLMDSCPSIPSVGFISLGCPKALVDSERILTELRAEGYRISPSYEGADLVVVNTCGFIDAAVEESLEAIGEALAENGKVIVTGCLGAKGALVSDRFPELLAVTGPHATREVLEAVHRHLPPAQDPFTRLIPAQGVKLTPAHYAYLKVSEGCNHRCSFCIIPALRGDLVSRPIGDVLDEAQTLVDAGVRELLVISQDTSAYGVDLKYRRVFWRGRPLKTRFFDLADALGELGVWIRLHYVYPYPHVDAVLPLMAEGKLLPYLDIPFQHASAPISGPCNGPRTRKTHWHASRRGAASAPISRCAARSSSVSPAKPRPTSAGCSIFSTGATDRVGCFTYSPVEGAAANALADAVPEPLKQERLERFMEKQAAISAGKLRARVGRRIEVLVDDVEDAAVIARSRGDAPEIDGQVIIDTQMPLEPGDLLEVIVSGSDDHDLFARVPGEAD